jgi:hypothetical protein
MSEPNVAPIPRALILERSEGCTSEDEIYTLSFHNLGLTSMRGARRTPGAGCSRAFFCMPRPLALLRLCSPTALPQLMPTTRPCPR